jgi:hypothetical protein
MSLDSGKGRDLESNEEVAGALAALRRARQRALPLPWFKEKRKDIRDVIVKVASSAPMEPTGIS